MGIQHHQSSKTHVAFGIGSWSGHSVRGSSVINNLWVIFEKRKAKSDFLHNVNLRNSAFWPLCMLKQPSKLLMRV